MRKLVSVIVPIYNVQDYLKRCVTSIIKQTYTNLEIILVDDGSTDNSSNLADQLGKSDTRICVYHKPNGGLSDARNYGIEKANGDYLCFIDSDDYIYEEYVEYLFALCEEEKCDIAICDFVRSNGEEISKENCNGSVAFYDNVQGLYRLYGSSYIKTVVAWNKLYRRELFDMVRFPVGRIHEDEATIYKLLYRAKKIADSGKVLYYYVQNPDSIMHKEFSIQRLDILKAIEERRIFFKEHHLMDLYYKDNYRMLTKILKCYYEIVHGNNEELRQNILHKLKKQYIKVLSESNKADWSCKRRLMLKIFYVFPRYYVPVLNRKLKFERKKEFGKN